MTEAGFDFRDREKWRLGDIIYSTPVVVGTRQRWAVSTHDPDRDDVLCISQPAVYYRDKVIYVGANDGMIHAFLMAKWDSTRSRYG